MWFPSFIFDGEALESGSTDQNGYISTVRIVDRTSVLVRTVIRVGDCADNPDMGADRGRPLRSLLAYAIALNIKVVDA